MARAFLSASTEYLFVNSAAITAYPLTMACWFNVANITAAHNLIFVGDKDTEINFTALFAGGSIVGDPILAFSHTYGVGGAVYAESTAGYSASTWHHAAGSWPDKDNRTSYLDGGNKGVEASSVGAMQLHDRTGIGASLDSTPSSYTDGSIAEAAIWNVVLTDAEVAVLATGISPLAVRPQSLVFYVPLIRDNDEDIVGGLSLSVAGTPTVANHPRVIYPASPMMAHVPIAAPPAGAIMNQFQQAMLGADLFDGALL